jgi:hypothetical protein
MYQVFKNGKPLAGVNNTFGYASVGKANQLTFINYEEARQALRKYIRQMVKKGKANTDQFGYWDSISRNPARFTHMGFTIRGV